ncbi:MAG: GyrI-like domain-containing protein [Solirubrobacterales bacterium]
MSKAGTRSVIRRGISSGYRRQRRQTIKKIDYKRELRELYAPRGEPAIVDVPDLTYLMIDGHGDPNTAPEFSEAIEALYTVAYTAKFAVKRAPEGIDYGVMPLEGLFWTPDMSTFTTEDKSAWDWTMMIMQPDLLTPEVFAQAQATAKKKKSLDAIGRMRLEHFAEGLAAQVLHIGPYAAEGPTIQRLHAFIAEQGYERAGKHHEVYLGDPRRAAPEKMKTIVRQPIAAAS